MKKWFYSTVILIALLSISAKAEIYTTPDGHRFEVNLIPDKTEILLGEPLYLSFEVKNLSNVDLQFVDGGDYQNRLGRPLSFNVKAVGTNGKEVPVPEIKYNMGGMSVLKKVEKNGGTNAVRLFLPLWSPFDKTSNYNITCHKSLGIIHVENNAERIDYFSIKTVPVSVKAKIKVVARNEAKMSEVIDFWGAEIVSSQSYERGFEALKILEYIDDKRIIKPLIKALTNQKEFWARGGAIKLLGKFDDDEEVFAAIVSQINHQSNSIRSAVAEALAFNKNPKAFEIFLKLGDDADKFVRLAVLQSLGRIGTPQTIKIMKEMLAEEKNKELFEYVKFYIEKPKT